MPLKWLGNQPFLISIKELPCLAESKYSSLRFVKAEKESLCAFNY
jgi:hypothetical protein